MKRLKYLIQCNVFGTIRADESIELKALLLEEEKAKKDKANAKGKP